VYSRAGLSSLRTSEGGGGHIDRQRCTDTARYREIARSGGDRRHRKRCAARWQDRRDAAARTRHARRRRRSRKAAAIVCFTRGDRLRIARTGRRKRESRGRKRHRARCR
jgi:hypothetical protein